MLLKTRGIVLRRIPYSESSIITDIYTEDQGRISCIISGVRKPRARVGPSLLEVMSILDLVVYYSEKSSLNRISEIRPAYLYRSIPFDVRKSTILLFMAELCSRTIRESEPNQSLFNCLMKYLQLLDNTDKGFANIHLLFMVEFADELGFGPSPASENERGFDMLAGVFTNTPANPMYYIESADELSRLIVAARQGDVSFRLDRNSRNKVLDRLVMFFRLHIETLKELKSLKVLRDIL